MYTIGPINYGPPVITCSESDHFGELSMMNARRWGRNRRDLDERR